MGKFYLFRLGTLLIGASAVVLCSAFSEVKAFAEPLQEIIKEHRQDQTMARRKSLSTLPPDVDSQSNYGKLFIDPKFREECLKWLGDGSDNFKIGKTRIDRQVEFIHATRVFRPISAKEILVNLMIPYPTYLSMVQYGLIKDFKELDPEPHDIETTETLDIKGYPGKLYYLKDARCRLNFKLAKETVLSLSSNTCHNSKEMVDLAEHLDIKRLEQKLNS